MILDLPINYDESSYAKRKEAREAYVLEQGGKCHHCGEPLNGRASKVIRNKKINWGLFPPQFLRHNIHLHHDHDTGMTIGAVHAYCNAVLWQYHGK